MGYRCPIREFESILVVASPSSLLRSELWLSFRSAGALCLLSFCATSPPVILSETKNLMVSGQARGPKNLAQGKLREAISYYIRALLRLSTKSEALSASIELPIQWQIILRRDMSHDITGKRSAVSYQFSGQHVSSDFGRRGAGLTLWLHQYTVIP